MRLIFTLFIVLVPLFLMAQPGDPGGDPDVPITGIAWLLLAGGLFGARKIYHNFRKR